MAYCQVRNSASIAQPLLPRLASSQHKQRQNVNQLKRSHNKRDYKGAGPNALLSIANRIIDSRGNLISHLIAQREESISPTNPTFTKQTNIVRLGGEKVRQVSSTSNICLFNPPLFPLKQPGILSQSPLPSPNPYEGATPLLNPLPLKTAHLTSAGPEIPLSISGRQLACLSKLFSEP